jgi:hypothetical protein
VSWAGIDEAAGDKKLTGDAIVLSGRLGGLDHQSDGRGDARICLSPTGKRLGVPAGDGGQSDCVRGGGLAALALATVSLNWQRSLPGHGFVAADSAWPAC